MQKIALVISILVLMSSTVHAQDATNAVKQTGFSESVAYQPREIKKAETKSKKEKKPENDSNRTTTKAENVDENSELSESKPVTIPVSVFDAEGKFIQGLQKSDFRVFVDNKAAEISSLETRSEPVSVVLLIDTSLSTQFSIEKVQNYALAIVEQLRPQDKVTVIEFNESLKTLSALTGDREQTRKAIRKIKPRTGIALYEAMQNLFEQQINLIEGAKAVVLLTDGVDMTSKKASYETSLAEAEKSGIIIFPVYFDGLRDVRRVGRENSSKTYSTMEVTGLQGLGPGMSSTQVSDMPKKPVESDYELGKLYLNDLVFLSGGRAIPTENLSGKQNGIALSIGEELSRQYYLTFTPSAASRKGQRKQIRVRVNRPNLAVLARGSYIVR